MRELATHDHSEREIAQRVGISRGTVHKYLTHDTFPERKERNSALGCLAPYADYLRRRWDEGCQNAKQLWRELQDQGYTGRPVTVWRFGHRWQGGPGRPPQPSRDPSVPPRPAPRAVVWWLLLPEKRTPAQGEFVERLVTHSPEIQLAQELVTEFFGLVRERRGQNLDDWIARAEASGLGPQAGFARSLHRDWEAVLAGLTLPWSNGPVEGQINRLKALKRQMYGRASFSLMRTPFHEGRAGCNFQQPSPRRAPRRGRPRLLHFSKVAGEP